MGIESWRGYNEVTKSRSCCFTAFINATYEYGKDKEEKLEYKRKNKVTIENPLFPHIWRGSRDEARVKARLGRDMATRVYHIYTI
jgi:hypothetical protein